MRCNLHCLGCYAGNYPQKDKLSYETIDQILKDAKTMGIYMVTVSGGEPFFREDLLDLFASHNDIYFQVFTNGTLIDTTLAKKISQLGNIAPVISCEGFEEETDHRRGRGTFKKICQAMDNLKEAGVIFGFSTVPALITTQLCLRKNITDFLLRRERYLVGFSSIYP
jgi:MoaA/NifB/PqqE/SkfB family radical SAM enzyme